MLPDSPTVDKWTEIRLPYLCKSKIEEVCQDILKRGSGTNYDKIYEALYELVEEEIEQEYFN